MKVSGMIGLVLLLVSSLALAESPLKKVLVNDITFLASDKLQGRANFSPGIEAAGHYIQERFQAIGLKPLADSDSLFQTVPVHQFNVKAVALSVNDKVVRQENIAAVGRISGNKSWDKAAINLVQVGLDEELKSVVSKLNKQGGEHLVIVPTKHKRWFNLYKDYFARGVTKSKKGEGGAIVMVLSSDLVINKLSLTLNIEHQVKTLFNVVGVLPGSELADEFVVYSAHYDHLGTQIGTGDQIFNGADDNASGTSAVINLAARFVKQGKPKRTLIFAAFAGEEIGGFGSKHFARNIIPEKISAMVNLEMLGKPSKFGFGTLWMTGPERSDLLTLINAKLKPMAMQVYPDPYPEQQLFYRSDNASLAKHGVPAHSFSTTQLDKDIYYHQPSDEIKTLDLDSMDKVVESIAVFGRWLNMGEITPSRIELVDEPVVGKIY